MPSCKAKTSSTSFSRLQIYGFDGNYDIFVHSVYLFAHFPIKRATVTASYIRATFLLCDITNIHQAQYRYIQIGIKNVELIFVISKPTDYIQERKICTEKYFKAQPSLTLRVTFTGLYRCAPLTYIIRRKARLSRLLKILTNFYRLMSHRKIALPLNVWSIFVCFVVDERCLVSYIQR